MPAILEPWMQITGRSILANALFGDVAQSFLGAVPSIGLHALKIPLLRPSGLVRDVEKIIACSLEDMSSSGDLDWAVRSMISWIALAVIRLKLAWC
jgi:hypothetical protein